MKSILVLTSLAIAPSFASSNTLSKANHYTCKGQDDLIVTLSTSSFTGEAQLYLAGGTIETDFLSETKLTETTLGFQASVAVKYLSDAAVDYTFIVPFVMVDNAKEQTVQAFLIRTEQGGLIDPELVLGPIQSNKLSELTCQASKVDF